MITLKDTLQKGLDIIHERQNSLNIHRAEFQAIMDDIHLYLDKQDSDNALKVLIQGAVKNQSSDVHMEIHETEASIRFRIDGALMLVGSLSLKDHTNLIERLKYRSGLKLNIHHVPQDGKFRLGHDETQDSIDIRVSVMPTRYGESIVCRVLQATHDTVTLDALGIIGPGHALLVDALSKKQGMILVTGPTGSGKTTTLYTVIDTLKNPEDKIITLEDPIEYQIPGILQSEINEHDGYTFALGVRSILRHDPDVIMIGEIRDLDTATTAIQASLTGHLVLSTLHTKSALETIDRLVNMGVSLYDIAASLDTVIAQRLVRKVCPHCAISDSHTCTAEEIFLLAKYGATEPLSRHGTGCEKCFHTGFHGRLGIYEIFHVTPAIRDALRANLPDSEILKMAQQDGFQDMREDARAKILLGLTTEEECQAMGIC